MNTLDTLFINVYPSKLVKVDISKSGSKTHFKYSFNDCFDIDVTATAAFDYVLFALDKTNSPVSHRNSINYMNLPMCCLDKGGFIKPQEHMRVVNDFVSLLITNKLNMFKEHKSKISYHLKLLLDNIDDNL